MPLPAQRAGAPSQAQRASRPARVCFCSHGLCAEHVDCLLESSWSRCMAQANRRVCFSTSFGRREGVCVFAVDTQLMRMLCMQHQV